MKKVTINKKDFGLEILFTGGIPSKKNSKQMICKPFPKLISSKAYLKWHSESLDALSGVKISPYSDVRAIEVTLYHKLNKDGSEPKKRFDLSNKFESIADFLVDIKLLPDDDYKVLPQVILTFGGYRPEQGADVYLYLENNHE